MATSISQWWGSGAKESGSSYSRGNRAGKAMAAMTVGATLATGAVADTINPTSPITPRAAVTTQTTVNNTINVPEGMTRDEAARMIADGTAEGIKQAERDKARRGRGHFNHYATG